MPELSEIHSLIDFGIVVVLWLVQIIIYPSFLRIDSRQLVDWHRSYTFRVSFVIMPLMLGQLGLAILGAIGEGAVLIDFVVLALVLICWSLTFFVSVPIHRAIDAVNLSQKTLQALVRTNWPRTILWTAIFFLGLIG